MSKKCRYHAAYNVLAGLTVVSVACEQLYTLLCPALLHCAMLAWAMLKGPYL